MIDDVKIAQAFAAGDYASAYKTMSLLDAFENECFPDDDPSHRTAFVLGYFATFTLKEMLPGDREIYTDAYFSAEGSRLIEMGCLDPRTDEYKENVDITADIVLHFKVWLCPVTKVRYAVVKGEHVFGAKNTDLTLHREGLTRTITVPTETLRDLPLGAFVEKT